MKYRRPLLFLITSIFFISNSFAVGTKTVVQDLTNVFQETKINQATSLLDWVRSREPHLHEKVKNRLLEMALLNPNFEMPKVEVSGYSNAGIDYARIIFKYSKENIIIDVHNKNGKYVFKINGKDKSFEDLYYSDLLDNNNLNPQMSMKSLDKTFKANAKSAAYYQQKMRDLINSVTEVQELSQIGVPKQVSYIDFILSEAYASYADGTCIVAGNMTKFDSRAAAKDKNICGLNDKSVQGTCGNGQFSCNPLVYGFTEAGSSLCVAGEKTLPAVYVSNKCNQLYSLENDSDGKKGEAFVSSVLKNKEKLNLKTEEDFYTQLTAQIASAGKSCNPDFDGIDFMNKVKSNVVTKYDEKDFLKGFPPILIKDKNDRNKQIDLAQGHRTACAFMMNRLVLAKKASACAELQTLAAESPAKQERDLLKQSCGTAIEPAVEVLPQVVITGKRTETSSADQTNKCNELSALIAKEKGEGVNQAEQVKLSEEVELKKCGLTRAVAAASVGETVKEAGEGKKNWCQESKMKTLVCLTPLILGAMCLGHILICPKKDNKPAPITVGKPGEPSNPRVRLGRDASYDGNLINRIFQGKGVE